MFPFVPLDLCHHHGQGSSRLDFWLQEKRERYIGHNQGALTILVETSLDKLTTIQLPDPSASLARIIRAACLTTLAHEHIVLMPLRFCCYAVSFGDRLGNR